MQARPTAILASMLLCLLALVAPAHAEFPGQNGKIVYADGWRDLWLIDPDGSNAQNLTNSPGPRRFLEPDWSPDGTRIAFTDEVDIFVMNADGSGQTNITESIPRPPEPAGRFLGSPSWSPDGTRIAFDRAYHDGSAWSLAMEVWIADADGSNASRLQTETGSAARPAWHPDGTRIAFLNCTYPCHFGRDPWVVSPDGSGETPLPVASLEDWSPNGTRILYAAPGAGPPPEYPPIPDYADIFVQNVDGSGRVNLTNTFDVAEGGPKWSPAGDQIVFTADGRLHVMNPDGSGLRRLTDSAGYQPDWQPIPHPRRSDYKNSAKFCKAEREALGAEAFVQKYGRGANAYGKCVSGK